MFSKILYKYELRNIFKFNVINNNIKSYFNDANY
jgi:hypothetical protein